MAKTYVSAIKYMVHIKFEVSGVVEKPDIIGAIFGQSEGLLGEEMDLKELQKNGKVGRLEIMLKSSMGKTKGEILVPSSMDMVETSILAAAMESVEKVGPCDSKFSVVNIEDVRKQKREVIKSRAKDLLEKFRQQLPESQQMREEVVERTRKAELITYGPDKLAAGPEIGSEDSIIVVEGRADVINLLKNNIKNAIAMGGTKISNTIVELGKSKSITVFVDGDRGGDLNVKKLQQIASVDFIARAPDGKEVEELVGKEIIQSLKKKVPTAAHPYKKRYLGRTPSYSEGPRRGGRRDFVRRPKPFLRRVPEEKVEEEKLDEEEKKKFVPIIQSLKGTLKAKLLDESMKEIKEVGVRDLMAAATETSGIYAIVFDGIITKRLAKEAEKKDIKYLIGIKKGKIEKGKTKAVAISA